MSAGERRFREAIARAGFGRRDGPGIRFHCSRLAEPGGDRRAAEAAYRAWLRREPDNERALEGLAFLLQLVGRPAEAAELRGRLRELELQHLGVARIDAGTRSFLLACESGIDAPITAPEEYVAVKFDAYASSYDEHMREKLAYRGPELLFEVVRPLLPHRELDVLDAGCGTGLAGAVFRPIAGRLEGVDLSPGMLARARERGIYDELVEDELTRFLEERVARYDLVVAADVLIYIGDLRAILAAIARALRPGGFFIFSIEDGRGESFRLSTTGRYAHDLQRLRANAKAVGLYAASSRAVSLRTENGRPVASQAVVLRSPPKPSSPGRARPG